MAEREQMLVGAVMLVFILGLITGANLDHLWATIHTFTETT